MQEQSIIYTIDKALHLSVLLGAPACPEEGQPAGHRACTSASVTACLDLSFDGPF